MVGKRVTTWMIAVAITCMAAGARADDLELSGLKKTRDEVAASVQEAEKLLEELKSKSAINTDDKTKELETLGQKIVVIRKALIGNPDDAPAGTANVAATLPAEVEKFVEADVKIVTLQADKAGAEKALQDARAHRPEIVVDLQERLDAITQALDQRRGAMRAALAARLAADDGAALKEQIKTLADLQTQYAAVSRDLAAALNASMRIDAVSMELDTQRRKLSEIETHIRQLEPPK